MPSSRQHPDPHGESKSRDRLGRFVALRRATRRHRTLITVVGSVTTAAVIAFILIDRRDEFVTALTSTPIWVLGVATLLQITALVTRSEAWHLTIEAAGGTVPRRILFRASSMQILGGVINGQLGVAARIAALRHSSPAVSPQVPTLIAAEFPIIAIEALLAALTSFTLIAPLGIPWWIPILGVIAVAVASAGLRHLAFQTGRQLWKGLAVARSLNKGTRVIAFVLLAIFAQIFRTWIMLDEVGVSASILDAVAVLIAISTLSQLPVGPSVGAAAAVLILGRHGVAQAAAAGLLLTVTGTAGGFIFAGWAAVDRLPIFNRLRAHRNR